MFLKCIVQDKELSPLVKNLRIINSLCKSTGGDIYVHKKYNQELYETQPEWRRDTKYSHGNYEIIQKINGQEFPYGPVFGALCLLLLRPVPSPALGS